MTETTTLTPREKRIAIWVAVGAVGGSLLLVAGALLTSYMFRTSIENAAGPNETAMVKAIAARDVAGAKAALAAGADLAVAVRVNGSGNMNSLAWLIVEEMGGVSGLESGRRSSDAELLEIGRAIFQAGGNPNSRVSSSSTTIRGGGSSERYLIEAAVGANSPDLIDVMVQAGLDVTSVGTGEALVEACRRGYADVAASLVAAGANVNHRARSGGRTPLSEAVHNRIIGLIDLLERAGAVEWGHKSS